MNETNPNPLTRKDTGSTHKQTNTHTHTHTNNTHNTHSHSPSSQQTPSSYSYSYQTNTNQSNRTPNHTTGVSLDPFLEQMFGVDFLPFVENRDQTQTTNPSLRESCDGIGEEEEVVVGVGGGGRGGCVEVEDHGIGESSNGSSLSSTPGLDFFDVDESENDDDDDEDDEEEVEDIQPSPPYETIPHISHLSTPLVTNRTHPPPPSTLSTPPPIEPTNNNHTRTTTTKKDVNERPPKHPRFTSSERRRTKKALGKLRKTLRSDSTEKSIPTKTKTKTKKTKTKKTKKTKTKKEEKEDGDMGNKRRSRRNNNNNHNHNNRKNQHESCHLDHDTNNSNEIDQQPQTELTNILLQTIQSQCSSITTSRQKISFLHSSLKTVRTESRRTMNRLRRSSDRMDKIQKMLVELERRVEGAHRAVEKERGVVEENERVLGRLEVVRGCVEEEMGVLERELEGGGGDEVGNGSGSGSVVGDGDGGSIGDHGSGYRSVENSNMLKELSSGSGLVTIDNSLLNTATNHNHNHNHNQNENEHENDDNYYYGSNPPSVRSRFYTAGTGTESFATCEDFPYFSSERESPERPSSSKSSGVGPSVILGEAVRCLDDDDDGGGGGGDPSDAPPPPPSTPTRSNHSSLALSVVSSSSSSSSSSRSSPALRPPLIPDLDSGPILGDLPSIIRIHDLGLPLGVHCSSIAAAKTNTNTNTNVDTTGEGSVDDGTDRLDQTKLGSRYYTTRPDLFSLNRCCSDRNIVLRSLLARGIKIATDEGSRWTPDWGTKSTLSKQSQPSVLSTLVDSNPITTAGVGDVLWNHARLGKDPLLWSGKLDDTEGYGDSLLAIKARGIVEATPEDVLKLLLDSSKVKTYNAMSLGRTDEYVFGEEGRRNKRRWRGEDGSGRHRPPPLSSSSSLVEADIDAPTTPTTRILRSLTNVAILRRKLELVSLLHAEPLLKNVHGMEGYVIVTRSVWENEDDLPPGNNRDGGGSANDNVRSEMLLGVNLIRKVFVDTDDEGVENQEGGRRGKKVVSEFTTVTHFQTPGMPTIGAKQFGMKSASNYLYNIRKQFG